MIQSVFEKRNMDRSLDKEFNLSDEFFNPREILGDGVEKMIAGLVQQPAQQFDRFVTNQVTNLLFKEHNNFGQDLAARNIQRGRDHGLASYQEYYEPMTTDPNK